MSASQGFPANEKAVIVLYLGDDVKELLTTPHRRRAGSSEADPLQPADMCIISCIKLASASWARHVQELFREHTVDDATKLMLESRML